MKTVYNDKLDPVNVIGICYVNGVDVGRIQINKNHWVPFMRLLPEVEFTLGFS